MLCAPNEFPAGYTLTAVLDVRNIDVKSELRMACAEGVGAQAGLHIGWKDSVSSLQRLSPDQLFVSYDTSGFPAGCTLQAWLDNGRAGRSAIYGGALDSPAQDSVADADGWRACGSDCGTGGAACV